MPEPLTRDLLGYWFARPDDSLPAWGVGSWTGPMPQTLAEARRYAEGRPLRVVEVREVGSPDQPTTKADLMAALIRGFEAGYDIGAQTDETPRHLHSLRAALNAGDPDVAEAFWASKAWTDDERKAVARAAEAWVRFAEVMGR